MAKHGLVKRVALGAAGIGLMIAAPFVGVFPGPGGIPLFLAGLGLLAINEPWAQRLLHYARVHSEHLRDILFPDNSVVQWVWDICVVALFFGATIMNIFIHNHWLRLFTVPLYTIAFLIFLFNRHRMAWVERKMKKLK